MTGETETIHRFSVVVSNKATAAECRAYGTCGRITYEFEFPDRDVPPPCAERLENGYGPGDRLEEHVLDLFYASCEVPDIRLHDVSVRHDSSLTVRPEPIEEEGMDADAASPFSP